MSLSRDREGMRISEKEKAVLLEVFQAEAGVKWAGKWMGYLGIPRYVLPACVRHFQKPVSEWMKIIPDRVGKEVESQSLLKNLF